jgi:hypothetical protein
MSAEATPLWSLGRKESNNGVETDHVGRTVSRKCNGKRSNPAEKSSSVKEKMKWSFKKKVTLDENIQQILTSNADCIKNKKRHPVFFFASNDFPFSCHLLV